jgi:hypothetical protein
MNHVTHRASSILKKPSPIRECIDPVSPIWACIDSGHPFEHVLTQGWTSAFCILFYKWFYITASSNDLIASKSRSFIWDTTRYGSFNFKILTLGYTIFDPGANHEGHWRSASWVAYQVLLSHQVWSWPNKKYSKNKVFISIMTWPNFDLDLWPLSLGMMVSNTLIFLYANDDVP